MPWYFPWSDSIKKRACRYLLQRYLGHFLKEKLTLDQLSVDLYNGKGTIKDLSLDVVSLNEALDSYNVPFEIVDGFIGSITVDIPWSALINDNTNVEVESLELTVQPKQRDDRAGVMLESMFTSMTSSLELAQECLRQDQTEGEQHADNATPFDGLEMFAMTIEAVLSRIKMSLSETVIRLEHLPKDAQTGAALELRIARVEYFDDIAADPGTSVDQPHADGGPRIHETPAVTHKNVHLMGVTLYCDEFPATQRTVSKVVPTETKMSESVSPPLFQPLNLTSDPKADLKDSEPIKVAVLMGKQELKLKIKQNEELPGPKMEVDCTLGILNLHLSPHQVHLLLEIASGLTAPDQCDRSNMRSRRSANRPMDPEDEDRVEQELQRHLQSSRLHRYGSPGRDYVGGLGDLEEPFATQSLDDSEDELYFDLDSQSVSMSMTSSVSSTNTAKSSSAASTTSYGYSVASSRREGPYPSRIGRSKTRSRPRDTLHKLLDDTSTELAKFRLRVSFTSLILLHKDPPTGPTDALDLDPGPSPQAKLRDAADLYFSRVCGINTAGRAALDGIRDEYSKACTQDHISVLCKPVTVETSQRCTSVAMTTTAELTVGLAEVVEVLFDRAGAPPSLIGLTLNRESVTPEYCELLVFPEDALPRTTQSMYSSMYVSAGPCVKVKVTSWEKTHQSPRRHSLSSLARTEVSVELAKCRSELDISLTDRIHALLTPQPLVKAPGPPGGSVYVSAYRSFQQPSHHSLFSQALDEGPSSSERPVDLRLTCPDCTLTVRFPIPDLRRAPGLDKPWWRRCLRDERLTVHLTDAHLTSSLGHGEPASKVEFMCREATASFQESSHLAPVPFIYLSKADSGTNDRAEEGFDWPRIEVKMYPKLQSQLEEVIEEVEDSNGADSLNGACQFDAPQPSPFSNKKVLYDNDELVLPGDRSETALFQERCLSRTELSLDLALPNVSVRLHTKDFFELVYNRLLNDLVLWEPVAPQPLDTRDAYSFSKGPGWSLDTVTPFMQQHAQPAGTGGVTAFSMCKSGIQYDSSSDSDEEVSEFYSATDYKNRLRQKQHHDNGRKSKVCVSVSVGRGRLSACGASKGEDLQAVAGCHGELCLDLSDGSFFTVVQTDGDPELQHMCLHVHQAALHHNGAVTDSKELPALTRAPPSLLPPPHLHPSLYLSDPGVETRSQGQVGVGDDSQDMLSLAVQVKIDLNTNVEECQVTLGVRGTTLLHKMTPTNQSWFDQLVDFFDVQEYPVLGYTKPQIVTQLHAHLWSCAIDYRPLFLPYRSLLTLETFSISSNVVAESPTSKLRFIVEDGALYIAHRNKCRHSKEVDLRRDYVCVADVGNFELILTSSDGKDPKYPKLDLRVSNNILHIRTCSDSFRALGELINYIAENGDIAKSRTSHTSQSSSATLAQSPSSSTLSESPGLTQSHLQHVHSMMADAMRESHSSSSSSQHNTTPDTSPDTDTKEAREIFFFPGESTAPAAPSNPAAPTSAVNTATGLPDVPMSQSSSIEVRPNSSDSEDSIEQSLSRLGSTMVLGMQGAELDADAEENQGTLDTMESSGDFGDAEDVPPREEVVVGAEDVPRSADDEFCIIDDPGLGIASRDGVPTIRVLSPAPVTVVDDHFSRPLGKADLLRAPKHFPPAVYKYTLAEMSVVWYMFGGHDFPSAQQIRDAKQAKSSSSKPMPGAKHRVRSSGKTMGKLVWQARGGEGRDMNTLLELQLSKVRLQHELYPDTTSQAARQILLVHEVEMRDRLASSKINKLLYQYTSSTLPRQAHANMVLVKAVHLRPDPSQPTQECSLRVSLQPLRLNIDQDSLFFLRTFFSELSEDAPKEPSEPIPTSAPRPTPGASPATPVGTPPSVTTPQKGPRLPVMSVSPGGPGEGEEEAEDLVKFDEMLEAVMDEDEDGSEDEMERSGTEAEAPIFFKSFIFSPDVPIRLDYHGKRVDMEQGTLAGLLVGLAHLNCSELRLKRLHHRLGLLGMSRLIMFTLNEWLKDIKRNQLPSILGGVGPMHSLVQLVQGVRDLFWLPVEQYRRDGHIIRGIQRGARSFVTCTAMSALELTNRVVQTVQYFAEVAFDMVSPGPSVRKKKYRKKLRRLTHPSDLREGVSNAYSVVTQGFKSTAEAIYHTAVDEHEQKGVSGAVGGVLRQIPPTVLQPVILATEATANVLGGMRNQLLPDRKREDDDKWKPEED